MGGYKAQGSPILYCMPMRCTIVLVAIAASAGALSGQCVHCENCNDATGNLKCFPCANASLVINFGGNESDSLSLTWAGEDWSMPGTWTHGATSDHFSGHAGVSGDTADVYVEMDYRKKGDGATTLQGTMTRNAMDRGSGYFFLSNCSFVM